ncbi:MAG: hypothetical protein ACTSW1_03320 [Candidatus Hodarchaeales archaeon]
MQKSKRYLYNITTILAILVIITSQSMVTQGFINENNAKIDLRDETKPRMRNSITSKLSTSENFIGNYTFDIESLYNYVQSLYDDDEGIFSEASNGYYTSVATFEALSILRFFGLDYYQFSSEWQKKEDKIANKLLIDLKDKSESGGYLLFDPESSNIDVPSLEGTFGVVTSLWVMNELPVPKLKQQTIGLLDFIFNSTFNKDESTFHELNQNASVKATFQALTILDLCYKVVLMPDLKDDLYTPQVTGNITEFMTNYSHQIFDYLDSNWVNNSYFDSNDTYSNAIADTWYSLQSISILERFADIIANPLPKTLQDYRIPVINWIKSLQKSDGVTAGGFASPNSEFATVFDTGMSYSILNLFNATAEIDHNKTLTFIYSSQFLKRENRTYLASEERELGGFSPNNLTHTSNIVTKRVSIHDTYYASLTLLLSGDIFSSLNISLETSHYQDNEKINQTNFIIQGQTGKIEEQFMVYDFKSHGSLSLYTFIDNWNLTQGIYKESNAAFTGSKQATYKVSIENDTNSDFNWTLGKHVVINQVQIRNLPVIVSPSYNCTTEIFVGYLPQIYFNDSELNPGDNITTTIFFQNMSTVSYSTHNISQGLISAKMTSPTNSSETLVSFEPINDTIGAVQFLWNISKDALLGSWILSIIFQNSSFTETLEINLEVTDNIFLYNISMLSEYYPGEEFNLNVSLQYSNGHFTQKANATVVFSSNKTKNEIFELKLEYLTENVYSTKGRICPLKYLYGFYNISVRLYWNMTSGYKSTTAKNTSFPVITIKGVPVISQASLKTDYRNLTISTNNLVYIGETINFSLIIAFKNPFSTNTVNDSSTITTIAGLINNSKPSTLIQQFDINSRNETLCVSGLIDPNLRLSTYGTSFQIKSEWNNSYVYIRDIDNISQSINYNITLDGELTITDVSYLSTNSDKGLHIYSLDTSSVIAITFKIGNSKFNNISVPNLNIYGILDYKNQLGKLNQSLPSITHATDENGSVIYLLSIPTANLNPNTYEINVYTWTAISNNYRIGALYPGFKIVKTLNPPPLFQLHELLIIVAGLGFVGLLYLNIKRLH